MSVDRRLGATSVVRVRILVAGLILLGAGCAVLGWGSRLRQIAASLPTASPALSGHLMLNPTAPAATKETNSDPTKQAGSILASLPLFFEPNQGQGDLDAADPRAKFINRGSNYSLFLGTEGAILSLASHDPQGKASGPHRMASATRLEFLQMKLAGANPHASVSATDSVPGKSNYFIGNDPAKWRQGIPHFARVRYESIYPGINLVFYGKQGQLEYDFQVSPGADPSQAQLEFNGAKQLELKDGALIIATERGRVRLEAPRVYQEIAGKQQPVQGSFVVKGSNRAGFAIGAYDRSQALIIDPILNFSTYFGGSGDEHATSVAVDGGLNIYLAGSTTSADLPSTSCTYTGCNALTGAQNVYIAKITPPLGSVAALLDNVTYLGGTGSDTPVGIKVDGGDYPYIAGTTSSTDFPTTATNAYQTAPLAGSPGPHVFVTKLSADFTQLVYSSYLSGNESDTASGMTIDPAGDIYVTGTTTSNNVGDATAGIQFPASIAPALDTAYQPISKAAIQFFVTKVNTTGSGFGSITFSTYFGGANFTPPSGTTGPTAIGGGIAVDTANQNIYFTGTTNFTYTGCAVCSTTDFPILNAYQPCLDSPPAATILNPQACTTSTTTTASDAFAAKLNPNGAQGQQLLWSTYLGGTGTDSGAGIALDTGAANVYVVGTTNSTDFVSSSAVNTYASFQKCLNNLPQSTTTTVTCNAQTNPPNDAFVARITNPTSTTGTATIVALNYFSYLGGANNEAGTAITVDSNSGAVIAGFTQSPFTNADGTFPLTPNPSSIQSSLNGTQDAFVARLNTAATVGQTTTASWATYYGGSVTSSAAASTTSGTGIALDVNQDAYLAGETNSTDLQTSKPLQAANGGTTDTYDAFVTQLGTAISLSIQGGLTLGTNQTFISAGNPATFTYTVTNNGPDLASNVTIAANLSQLVTIVPLTNITASITSGTCGGGGTTNASISCGPISLQSGSTATLTITATPTANSDGSSPEFFNGGTIQAMAPGNIVLAQTSVSAEMSDFSMSVSPANQNIPQAGATATYQVQLTPHPLFNSNITLSCTGFPSGSSCNFSPGTSVSLQGASGSTATLAIPTQPRPITPAASLFRRQFYAFWLVVPGLALLGIGGDRRRRRIAGISLICLMFALVLFIPACSHSTTQTPASGTPAGNYTITVTASSGTDSKSQTITLSVP